MVIFNVKSLAFLQQTKNPKVARLSRQISARSFLWQHPSIYNIHKFIFENKPNILAIDSALFNPKSIVHFPVPHDINVSEKGIQFLKKFKLPYVKT